MTSHPLLHGRGFAAPFARRAGQPISVEAFLRDVAALAAQLPARFHVVNLCPDRYRFAVGFAAALCRGQVNLLPPHDAPDLLRQLTADYPDLYCLTDTPSSRPGIAEFRYPETLSRGGPSPAVPMIDAQQRAAVLFTSGSTGQPSPHGRSWGDLVTSAQAEGSRLGLERLGGASLLGTVPHQHSFGLESLIMLALRHDLVLHAERLFYPADIKSHLAAVPRPSILVTTPVHLRVLLSEPEPPPPPVDLVLCATAPLAAQLAREAETRFAARLLEIYGCSEAGQIAARRTALTEEWRCLDGIVLRQETVGDTTTTWATGTPIAVPTVLPDVIELQDETRFLLHGRIADMVNVAGKRTSLVHLNYHLNAIDGVRDGAFVMPDDDEPTGISRLTAFVVAPGLSEAEILEALRRRIDAAFLPRPICLVPVLPRNALGKLPRDEVRRLIADAGTDSLSTAHLSEGRTAAIRYADADKAAVGHFPGNPIIPGAILLRDIVAAIAGGRPVTGTRIRSVKFHRPVRPGETIEVTWREDAGEIRFAATLSGSDHDVVTGSLRLPSP